MTAYEWADPSTGELLTEWREGCVEVLVEEPEPERERQPDREWLGDWYTRELVRLEAEEKAAREQHARVLAALKARRRSLEWRWLERFEAVVREALTGRQKSADYAFGRAGWRKSKRVEVEDEAAALAWAREHAPEAVKVRESLSRSALPADAEVPGVRRVEEDVFFVRGGGA